MQEITIGDPQIVIVVIADSLVYLVFNFRTIDIIDIENSGNVVEIVSEVFRRLERMLEVNVVDVNP